MKARLGRLAPLACTLVCLACDSGQDPTASSTKNAESAHTSMTEPSPPDASEAQTQEAEHDATAKHDGAPGKGHAHAGHGPAPHHEHKGGHHRFEDAEEWAKVFDDPERDAWQKPQLVVDWLNLRPTDKVADIGAGTGYFAMRFATAVPEGKVFGNDIETSMVDYMTQRAAKEGVNNLVAVQGTPSSPGLTERVDLAFVCDVYHHIEDRPTYFKALGEQLTAEGRLVIVDFDPAAPEDAPGPPKAMRIAPDQVIAELGEAGFMLGRRSTAMLPYQYALEFTRKP